jgi:hypothetical protein
MDIEASENCTSDYLEVFDGPIMTNLSSFGRLCGPQPPQGHRKTSGNSAVIRFFTDHSGMNEGFMAVVTATFGAFKIY